MLPRQYVLPEGYAVGSITCEDGLSQPVITQTPDHSRCWIGERFDTQEEARSFCRWLAIRARDIK